MPNLLSNLIDPQYSTANYPGREQLLSQIMGQGHARAPAIPAPSLPIAPRMTTPSMQMPAQPQEYAWQKAARKKKEKQNIKNAFSEIVETRNKSGQPFLSEMERLQIFTNNNVPEQVAMQFNSVITAEQAKAEPKYHMVKKTDPTTGDITQQAVSLEDLKGGVSVGRAKKEKPKVPTLKPMLNKNKEWTYHKFDSNVNDWVDTGRGAAKPEKPGQKVNKHRLTAKEQFAHNRERFKFVNENLLDIEEGEKPMARKKFKTQYDASIFGWEPTVLKETATGKTIEVYKTPFGVVDMFGDPLSKPKAVPKPKPEPTEDKKDRDIVKQEALEKKKEIKYLKRLGNTPAEEKAGKEAARQEMVDLANKLGVGKKDWKEAWSLYKDIAKWAWGSWDNYVGSLRKGQKEARESLGR